MTSRSTRDLMKMIRNSKNQDMKESYGGESYDNVPNFENEPSRKMPYPKPLNTSVPLRGSTGQLRNLSSYKPSDNFELPMIKNVNKESLATVDLEQKLK